MQIEPIAAIATIISGGVVGIIQWHKSNKIRQAEFINQIIMKIRFDEDIAKTMYTFDYVDDGNEWYDDKFHDSEKEKEIDRFFSYLTYICYLYDTKNIGNNEFHIFEYAVKMVCLNKQAQIYLWNLYHYTNKHLKTKCSFHHLIDYLRNKVFSAEEKIRFDSQYSSVSGYAKRLEF